MDIPFLIFSTSFFQATSRMTQFCFVKKDLLKVLSFALCLCSFIPSFAQYKRNNDPQNYKNWELTAGMEGMSFHSLDKKIQNLSANPLAPSRFTLAASFGVNKWLSPYIGLRTRFSGYWGKAIVSNNAKDNNIKFYSFEEHVMLNFCNLVAGPDYGRIYNFIPHAGLGFTRDGTHKDNSLGIHAGALNTIRLSKHMGLYLDLGYHLAGNQNGTSGRYNWYSGEIGVCFKIGRESKNAYHYRSGRREITVLNLSRDYYNTNPYGNNCDAYSDSNTGMVKIMRGSVYMGDTDCDSLWGRQIPQRRVSVDDFWMDKTEITNAQYQEFVNDVVQSVIEQKLNNPYYEKDSLKVVESLYITNPITGAKTLDGSQLVFAYETYDEMAAAMKEHQINPSTPESKRIFIRKDTAFINSKGDIVRETISRPLSSQYDFLNTYIVNVLPDTTVWVNDFPNADNSMYLKYYYSHPDYQNHPVVGVSWEQANAYCAWRTEKRKMQLGGNLGLEQPFRLPTEAEWELAARGGSDNKLPWDDSIGREGYALLANFLPEDGDYTKDGNIITSRVGIYPPNSNNLYDMAGNVAEWTSTAYSASGAEVMNNINPQINHNAANEDPDRLKRKVVKGGSWKDPETHILSAWRTAEYQYQQRSYIGFRCVRSIATKPSERIIRIKR